MFDSPKRITCNSLVAMKLMLETDGGHEVLLCKLTWLKFWVEREHLPIQFSWAAARLLVYTFATVCQVDETVLGLLVPSKKMRTLGETFFVYGVNQGG